ncbi:MAG: NADH-quinone oxidoreductase subunit A [Candidatus Omnitrophota bacterium]|jgi:NADH:ubiquinone oxidoreductase subunit 3 (subunit A)
MTDSSLYHNLFIVIFVLVAVAFGAGALIFAWFIAPRKPSRIKDSTYECGLVSEGDPWIQYRVQYYLFALLFVIFDVETVFIYPWAVAFKRLGLFAFVEMMIFIAILAAGLIYAWRKNTLEWE